MKDIIPLQDPNPAVLFAPGGLDDLLTKIETDTRSIATDASTANGRKEIASLAARIARSKTYLDSLGKGYVAELKAMPKKIDASRKAMRDRLDALKADIRRPLTEYEQKEANRKAKIRARLDKFAEPWFGNAAEITARIAMLEDVAIDDSWDEFTAEAAKAKDAAIRFARTALAEAKAEEQAEAERRACEERERRDREARIVAEAAERARQEAERNALAKAERIEQEREVERLRQANAMIEAKRREDQAKRAQEEAERKQQEAERHATEQSEIKILAELNRLETERRRSAEEDRQRADNLAHRKRIHDYMAAELRQHVISIDAARDLVSLIAAGKIANLKIVY